MIVIVSVHGIKHADDSDEGSETAVVVEIDGIRLEGEVALERFITGIGFLDQPEYTHRLYVNGVCVFESHESPERMCKNDIITYTWRIE